MDGDLILLELFMLEDTELPIYEDGSNGIYKIYKNIEVFIKKMINTMKAFVKRLKLDVERIIKERRQSKAFKEAIITLKENKDKKVTVTVANVGKVIKLYQENISKFRKELKEIISKAYKRYDPSHPEKNLDGKIAAFNEKLDSFEQDINDILENDVVVKKGEDAIRYLENISKGIDPIFSYYNGIIHDFDAFVIEAEKALSNKMLDVEKHGAYLLKTKGLIQRFSNKSSNITRKVVFRAIWFTL